MRGFVSLHETLHSDSQRYLHRHGHTLVDNMIRSPATIHARKTGHDLGMLPEGGIFGEGLPGAELLNLVKRGLVDVGST